MNARAQATDRAVARARGVGAIGTPQVLHFAFARGAGILVFGVIWSGAFLACFGVRSHIASLILLRLVFLLRGGGREAEALLGRYEDLYVPKQRLDELLSSGLAEREGSGLRVTPKGLGTQSPRIPLRSRFRLREAQASCPPRGSDPADGAAGPAGQRRRGAESRPHGGGDLP